ncbi:MAG TPA: uroporphyrinogen decarboxylase [Rhodopila sp.]|nr:uroporphyrinogen decarboxylase [Rhodopila sp.]HVY16374.1 uroporphyrinogen decarboxylase [Rhodopila sp.]
MKRLLRSLNGEAVWPPPVWLMRQAGRYLPEYRAVRARVPDFVTLCTSPDLAAEVTLQPIRRYGFDAAILFSDILILPWALGHGLAFKEGEGPVLPRLRDAAGVAALDPRRLAEKTAPVMETVRRIRAGLRAEGFGNTALIGFAGAPFTVACYMVEGGGSKDFAAVRAMAYAEPDLFARLMDTLTEATIAYLSAQVEAGAEVLMLFDSWAGVLSPGLFRRHAAAPAQRIVSALKARHPDVPVIGFPRLAGILARDYAATGVDGIGIDTGSDIGAIAALLPPGLAVQGNLDPMALVAGGEALRTETRAILAAMKGRPFVFNLGHGIVPQTPPENVAALLELVRAG